MDNLLTADYTSTSNVKYRQISDWSGTVAASFSRTASGACWLGVGWYNGDVYFTKGTGGSSNFICKGTGFSGTIQASFAVPASVDGLYAFDIDSSGNFIIVNSTTKCVRTVGFSSTVGSSFTDSGGNNMRGVVTDGTNFYTDIPAAPIRCQKRTSFSGTVSSSVLNANFDRDCTWDGTNIIATRGNGHSALFAGFSSTITASFTIAPGDETDGTKWQGFPSAVVAPKALHTLLLLGIG